MSVFNEHAAIGMPQPGAVERILQEYRARRERAQSLLARQHELLSRLCDRLLLNTALGKDAVAADAQLSGVLNELSQRQELWQQRHSEDLQRHESLLDAVSEQLCELAAQLAASERAPPTASRSAPTAPAPTPASNWEQAKQRLLQELENDESPSEPVVEQAPLPAARSSRRDLELIVAQKDQEIVELRRQLAEAPGPAVDSSLVDGDDIVQRERANLRRLQEEWQEKLKKAEVDISIERAKLARERTQLEERIQALQRELAGGGAAAPTNDAAGKANRNRWLSRLGLLDE